MTTETLVLLIIVVLILGALPTWPYSRSWGYAPPSVLAILLIVFLVWAIGEGRMFSRSSGKDVQTSVQDVGHDLKATGRDVADSIRRTVQ